MAHAGSQGVRGAQSSGVAADIHSTSLVNTITTSPDVSTSEQRALKRGMSPRQSSEEGDGDELRGSPRWRTPHSPSPASRVYWRLRSRNDHPGPSCLGEGVDIEKCRQRSRVMLTGISIRIGDHARRQVPISAQALRFPHCSACLRSRPTFDAYT
jgi:hypothetical protein